MIKVFKEVTDILIRKGEYMARIIEEQKGCRRLIKLTTDDILSVVQDYQRIVPRGAEYNEIRNSLDDFALFLAEDC